MIPRFFFIVLGLYPYLSFSQVSDSEMESLKTKWRVELSEKAQALAKKTVLFDGNSDFSDSIQRLFLKDTFVVENLLRKQLEKDLTNLGINKANLACSSEYEQLVAKYYAILSLKMDKEDKQLLETWNQDWKKLMDSERALIGRFMQEMYSGGGSIHSIRYTNRLMMQQKNHLLMIIDYLTKMV